MAQNIVLKMNTKPAKPEAAEGSNLPVPASRGTTITRTRYAEFLPDLEAIAEREHSPYARRLAIATAVLFAVLIGWASIAKVDQDATAPATVRPAGKVKVINHPEGGMVAEIFVHEGDRVHEGQPLVRLDARVIDQELARLTGEWQSLSAEIQRLEAEIGNKPLSFSPELAASRPDLVSEQRRQYDEDRRALISRQGAADEKTAQAKGSLASLEKKEIQSEQAVKVSVEQERVLAELTGKGYFPKLRYLSVKRQLTDDQGQLAQTREEMKRARAAVAEAQSQREQGDAEYYAKLLDRLAQAHIEAQRAFRGMKQQQAKRESLSIDAPVTGIVQNMVVASPGQAVRPGEPIMNIVPTADTLIIEARISNNDIGYISVGQAATVKIDTYPYVRFGTLEGKVESIAADANKDEKTGQTFFNVYIRTNRTYLGDKSDEHLVNPGMQGTADLHIGKRSIIAFLTDRFRQKVEGAFKEP